MSNRVSDPWMIVVVSIGVTFWAITLLMTDPRSPWVWCCVGAVLAWVVLLCLRRGRAVKRRADNHTVTAKR